MYPFWSQAISHRVSCIVGIGDAFAAWVNDCKQHSFPTDRCTGLQDYESPNRDVFVVPDDCWSISRWAARSRSEEHTSELQSLRHLVCRLLLEKKKTRATTTLQSMVSSTLERS